MNLNLVVPAILAIAAIPLLALGSYFLLLTLAALLGRAPLPPPGAGTRRFAILIPAHDEELLIGRLLASLRALDYPQDHYVVYVVADNCADRTAEIARRYGAHVLERHDTALRGKGHALRWLLERVQREPAGRRGFDAYVVLDADSVVSTNFLRSMAARLAAGSRVIQAHYSVLNAQQSSMAGLRYAALAAVHYLRPLGRAALGLSCGLKGNGMCFAAPVLDRFSWRWYTLAEDVEFHLELVRHDIRVDFAPEAQVLADMPVTLAQAASQNARWERGRVHLLRTVVPALLREGVQRRSALRLDAAVEQCIPPLSAPFALSLACLTVSLATGALPAAALAGLALAQQTIYLGAALALVRAPARAYLALASAPAYVAWKVGLYLHALVSSAAVPWVRTDRLPGSAGEPSITTQR